MRRGLWWLSWAYDSLTAVLLFLAGGVGIVAGFIRDDWKMTTVGLIAMAVGAFWCRHLLRDTRRAPD